MKKLVSLLLGVALSLALVACGTTPSDTDVQHAHTGSQENSSGQIESCDHDYADATCTEPKKCTKCGEASGEALGHEWSEATCTAPKKCAKCGETSGTVLDHSWTDATCTDPKKCTKCGETSGSALEHSFTAATCTDAPKCTKCGKTNGSALGHTWKDATCTEAKNCSKCGITSGSALGHAWKDATCTEAKKCTKCGTTSGKAIGHTWKDATCTEAKKCTKCGTTSGTALGHSHKENGLVGKKIKYKCIRCSDSYEKEMKELKANLEYTGSSLTFVNGTMVTQFNFEASATGGYGKYQYKFETFQGETIYEHLTSDFSESDFYGLTSPYGALAFKGNTIRLTVKDDAGNQATFELDMTKAIEDSFMGN